VDNYNKNKQIIKIIQSQSALGDGYNKHLELVNITVAQIRDRTLLNVQLTEAILIEATKNVL